MKYFLVSVVMIIHITVLFAQHPAYFTLGKQELQNQKIYSVFQNRDDVIYITTNDGLFKYSHGKFVLLPSAKEQLGNSLFGLTEDADGRMYCYNFQGQIFRIDKDQLHLVCSLPQEGIRRRLEIFFYGKHKMLVMSKDLSTYDTKTWERENVYDTGGRAKYLGQLANDTIVFSGKDGVYKFHNDSLYQTYYSITKDSYIGGFMLGDFLHIYASPMPFVSNPILSYGDAFPVDSVYTYMKNHYISEREFIGFRKAGDYFADWVYIDDNKVGHRQKWQFNTFVSAFGNGAHGEILLGTFNDGLYIIPNKSSNILDVFPDGERIRSFVVNKGVVYFSTEKNRVFKYDKQLELIHDGDTYEVDRIYYLNNPVFKNEKLKKLFFSISLSTYTFISSVKDLEETKNGDIIYATSRGIFLYSASPKVRSSIRWTDITVTRKSYDADHSLFDNIHYCRARKVKKGQVNGRVSHLSWDKSRDVIYIGMNGLLMAWDSLANINPVLFKGEKINVYDTENDNDTIYVASKYHGVLQVVDGHARSFYNQEDGLKSFQIRQLKVADGQMFILHDKGIQVVDMQDKSHYSIGRKEGFDERNILNFDVEGASLWINERDKILKIDLTNVKNIEGRNLELRLDSITVNEERIDIEKQLLSYKQKNIAFYTNFTDVSLEQETELWFKLDGIDEQWEHRDIHDYIIQYKSLSPGQYTFRAYAKYRNQKSEEIRYTFIIEAPVWQRWWFYLLIAIMVGGVVYFILDTRVKRLQYMNEISLEKETAKREQIDAELKALRSQMNPHFIFNALNSIQDLILQEETDKSYDYIVIFAELVRSTLNFSNHQFISIGKEMDFLDVYLQLEQLRFAEDFSYKIQCDIEHDIQIPSLLIQPFIENALLHGLLHKEGAKRINIHLYEGEHLVCCEIIDNGIGRAKSKEINRRFKRNHQSFALDAIRKRLDYFNKIGEVKSVARYEVIDLLDEKGVAKGTKVIVYMPFEENY